MFHQVANNFDTVADATDPLVSWGEEIIFVFVGLSFAVIFATDLADPRELKTVP